MNKKLHIKWKIRGLPLIVITKDNEVWQMPFVSKGKLFSWRKIEPKINQGVISYLIQQKRYSKKQLRELAYYSEEIQDIGMLNEKDLPF